MKTPLNFARSVRTGCALGLGLVGFVQALQADWDPSDPAKWIQLPDLNPTGLDVNATFNPFTSLGSPGRIVADDFLCTLSGPITDIHIWGSWLFDFVPTSPVQFHLSIHSDIPAGTGDIPWSRPGQELWSVNVLPTAARIYGQGNELFYDPPNGIIGGDTQVWQYNFLFDEQTAFEQQEGTIYWLDVQALVLDQSALFGWKTRDPFDGHFNDDAAWNLTPEFGGPIIDPSWHELRYPEGHPFQGQSMDMAFVLTTTAIPEASTWAATGFLTAIAGLTLWRRRRQ